MPPRKFLKIIYCEIEIGGNFNLRFIKMLIASYYVLNNNMCDVSITVKYLHKGQYTEVISAGSDMNAFGKAFSSLFHKWNYPLLQEIIYRSSLYVYVVHSHLPTHYFILIDQSCDILSTSFTTFYRYKYKENFVILQAIYRDHK